MDPSVELESLRQLAQAQHQQILTLTTVLDSHTVRLDQQARQLEFLRLQIQAGLVDARYQTDRLGAVVADLRSRLYSLWQYCIGFNNILINH